MSASRQLILGTAGHIDHGKTALVRALTGVDTDRLPDERRRGITIDLGFAHLELPGGVSYGVVDVPGHEAFVRNMVAGATGVDVAILVVAADEGVMPQTREHLAILRLLGVPRMVVALTKADLVEPAWLELVMEEVSDVLAATPHASAPLVAVSARTGSGMEALREHLAAAGASARERAGDDLFRMPVDRAFSVHGTGTVATGTVWSGQAAADAALRVLPADVPVRARGAQVHGAARPEVRAGERAALALAGIDRAAVGRGATLVAAADGWRPSAILTVRLALLPDAPGPLVQRQRVRLHLGTAEVMARVRLLEGATLEPGAEGWAQLRLEAPILARARDRFVVRRYSPVTTLGGGVVAEACAPKRRRLSADAAAALAALHRGGAREAVVAAAEVAGATGAARVELSMRTGLPPAQVAAALAGGEDGTDEGGVRTVGDRIVPAGVAEDIGARLLELVDRWHAERPLRPGAPLDVLRAAAPPGAASGLVDHVVAGLEARGVVRSRGPWVARVGHVPTPGAGQATALAALEAVYTQAGLAPPEEAALPAELAGRADLADLLDHLQAAGTLVQLMPGLLAHAAALADAERRVRAAVPAGTPAPAADFKAPLGVTRKHLIPLLEYLDRIGVTRREGDLRTVLPLETAPGSGA